MSARTIDRAIQAPNRHSKESLQGGLQATVNCAHCGGACSLKNKNCASCGSPIKSVVYPQNKAENENHTHNKIVGFAVWLFLGLFGGFAYWSGDKIKAYARAMLWVAIIASAAIRGNAQDTGFRATEAVSFSIFGIGLVLIFIFWLFDLARLLRH